jgi:hypothetical protein
MKYGTIKTRRGNDILIEDQAQERLNAQALWSTRSVAEYTVLLAMRTLGLIPNDPRHVSTSHVVCCRSRGYEDCHQNLMSTTFGSARAVIGIEWLSIPWNGNNTNAVGVLALRHIASGNDNIQWCSLLLQIDRCHCGCTIDPA